jgi:hypothetical protein
VLLLPNLCKERIKIKYIAILMLALEDHVSLLNKPIISGIPKYFIFYYRHMKTIKPKSARNWTHIMAVAFFSVTILKPKLP